MNEPWSKKHKKDFGSCPFSLSNSFAQPLSQAELTQLTLDRGDDELLQDYNTHSLEYTPNGGSLDLKEEIANLYSSNNITADNVIVTTGAQVALQTAALAFGRNCHVIVFVPGYQSTIQQVAFSKDKKFVTHIPRSPENKWQIDIDQVEKAIRDDTKFMILNEPYNPAGTLMSKETQAQLVVLARQHDIVILCDEVYRLLEHDSTTRLPAICEIYEKGISVVTLSKPWGACGITIGWLAVADPLEMKQALVDVQYFGTACPSRASELQAIMVLRSSENILKRNLQIILHNKRLLQDFIQRYSDLLEWIPPTAGAICAVKFKGPLSSLELGYQLQQQGISIKPAYCFSDNITPEMDYFRIGFGEAKMPQALHALETFVQQHEAEWRAAIKTNRNDKE